MLPIIEKPKTRVGLRRKNSPKEKYVFVKRSLSKKKSDKSEEFLSTQQSSPYESGVYQELKYLKHSDSSGKGLFS